MAADELLLEDVLDDELDGVEVDDVEDEDEELLVLDGASDDVLAGVELLAEDRESVR